MKKRYIRVVLAILLVISLMLSITYSYAIDKSKETVENKTFFVISNLEAEKEEKIEMIINLEEIEYDKFLFELTSSEDLESTKIEMNDKDTEIEKNKNEISIEIDKRITNLNTINLYYEIPETVNINDKIKFIAIITNIENEDVDNNEDIEYEEQTVELEVKIVDKKEENEKNETNNQEKMPENEKKETNNQEKAQENENKETEGKKETPENVSNKQENNEKSLIQNNNNNLNKQISNINMTSNNQKNEQEVVYKGSDNNYLKKISINGYTLNKEFSKDNSTYFVEIKKNVGSLEITANADDKLATVCVYGNENLNNEINKILISVTAENGTVRNYRIYVNKGF